MSISNNIYGTTIFQKSAIRKESLMGEKEQLYKIIQNDTARRTASGRRQSIILHHKLLKLDKQDRRSMADRRRGKEKRIKSIYNLKW